MKLIKSHHIPKLIFQGLTNINYFCYDFPINYQRKPKFQILKDKRWYIMIKILCLLLEQCTILKK